MIDEHIDVVMECDEDMEACFGEIQQVSMRANYDQTDPTAIDYILGREKLLSKDEIKLGIGEGEDSIQQEGAKALGPKTIALGTSIAGCKGYYYSAIHLGGKCILLSETQVEPVILETNPYGYHDQSFSCEWQVGDKISIVNGAHYDEQLTIAEIDGNIIFVAESIPFNAIQTGDTGLDAYSVCVPARPEAGVVPLGEGAISAGDGGSATGRYSSSFGRQNRSFGDYSFTAGRKCKAAYASGAVGYECEALGQGSFTAGWASKSTGNNSVTLGGGLNNPYDNAFIGGWCNDDTIPNLLMGIGYGFDGVKKNAFNIDTSGNVWVDKDPTMPMGVAPKRYVDTIETTLGTAIELKQDLIKREVISVTENANAIKLDANKYYVADTNGGQIPFINITLNDPTNTDIVNEYKLRISNIGQVNFFTSKGTENADNIINIGAPANLTVDANQYHVITTDCVVSFTNITLEDGLADKEYKLRINGVGAVNFYDTTDKTYTIDSPANLEVDANTYYVITTSGEQASFTNITLGDGVADKEYKMRVSNISQINFYDNAGAAASIDGLPESYDEDKVYEISIINGVAAYTAYQGSVTLKGLPESYDASKTYEISIINGVATYTTYSGDGTVKGLPESYDASKVYEISIIDGYGKYAIVSEAQNILTGKLPHALTFTGAVTGTYDGSAPLTLNIPAGGGGSGTNNAVLNATNETGWISKTIAEGAECDISFAWSSIENNMSTGNGAFTLSVGDVIKLAYEITQGKHSIDIGKYLSAGTNKVKVEISDVYGNTRVLSYTINCVQIGISSYFDGTLPYTGEIPFSYTPVGAVDKTVHFLVDGKEIDTRTVTVSGREASFTIPAQAHGSHTFEVYFTADIEGQVAESNHLFYDLICYEEGRTEPIISIPVKITSVKQYSTVAIPYIVYTPNLLTSSIELINGDDSTSLTVDRKQQIWSYKVLNSGTANLSIKCGDTVKPISFNSIASEINVSAETENLELYLTSIGRSNNENNPLEWKSGSVEAELTGFNLVSDGWKPDADSNTVLRVAGDARVYIPFNIFGSDFRTTGKTVEIEFATSNVLNYDATIISAWSGERGIKITAQKAMLKSEQSEIFTQYKENETVRIAFTVEKKAENRLLAIYINGIMSGVVQYPADDDFAQSEPVGISIGSNECTTDIYCIRVYNNNLSRYQILDNWIADTQDVETLIERYDRNNIFDDYGNIVTSKIPNYLPYMVLNVSKYSDLPQSKGDKKTVSGVYVDPLNPKRSFSFTGAEIDVQGTSSQYYSRKNYKIKFKGGFVIDGTTNPTYQLRDTSMPTNEFTYKADVASSEGANNVELAKLYDDTCPVKTPPQQTDSRVRQGIEGYPMLMFYGQDNDLTFLGKYNFNNDKGTGEVFGFESGDESWEILQNNTEMVIWKDDNFEGESWKTSFEARYPDKSTDTTNLAAFSSWLKSTDTTAVDTDEEKAARIEKFKTEFADWCNVDAMLFNYIFTEMFLMVDNRAKNAFPTRYDEDGKWLILPYDYDTAIGINNEGELKFGYDLEDIDQVNGNNVFNGQDSVLYVNMRLAFKDEIMEMYKTLRSGDVFSYEEIEKRFEEHQSAWGEAVFNEDARFKYIDPLVNEGNSTYLPMLQGSKAEQRKWWLYNRFRYLDSKYNAGDALEDYIMLRSYAVADIEVTPYADIYATAKFDSALVQKRALRGNSYTLENPLSGGRDAVISIYSASQLSSIGDVSGLKPGMADFSKAVKLSNLKVGDATEGYDNPNLTDLTIGNLTLLRTLDVRNCSALTQAIDVSGCTNIENVYFDGTATTGVTLPNGGNLKVLHLPSTVTNLTILNQKKITDFTIPSYANISTLRIENTPIVDTLEALGAIQANSRVRLIGVDWTLNTPTEVFTLMDKLDTFRGLDENGNNLNNAVVSGVIHINSLSKDELSEMNARYPNITIDYKIIRVYSRELVEGTITEYGSHTLETVGDHAFYECYYLTTVDFPSVTSIGDYAFWHCYGLTTVDAPSVTSIGSDVFSQCYDLTTVDAPLVTSIGSDAFNDCSNLTAVDAPLVTSIGSGAFSGCSSLTTVDFPLATSIGGGAFGDCSNLTTVDAPLVTSIGSDVFGGCSSLTTVDAPLVTSIGSRAFKGCLNLTTADFPLATRIGYYAFLYCHNLTTVDFPLVTSIESGAFGECSSLTTADFPSVTSIGNKAFQGNYLTTLILRNTEAVCTLSDINAFAYTPIEEGTGYIYVPKSLIDSYKTATNWTTYESQFRAIEDYPDICGEV